MSKVHKISSIKFYTRTELQRIMYAANKKAPRDYVMILLAYRHGLRGTEICQLQMEHIDLKEGQILCVRLKNSVTTWQHMADDEVEALAAWLPHRPCQDSAYVFCTRSGKPMDRAWLYRRFRRIAVKAGIPKERCRPHALKHSLGTHLAQAGVPPQIIQRRLGHRNIGNTMVYLSIADGLVDQAVQEALSSGAVV